jgi:hypothetical protein
MRKKSPATFAVLIVVIAALGVWPTGVVAADITVLRLPGGDVSIVSVKGQITSGDADEFYDAVSQLKRATVLLEGPGGLVSEALRIGAKIRIRGFATMVAPDAGCYSACGIIWVSGARRYMSPTSRIGFHAAFKEERGEYLESGVANAEIGSFLTHLGLRIEAIRFFTIAGPNEYLLLTPARARALGIDVYEQYGTQVITPEQAPSVNVYADRFVSYGILRSRCVVFFQMDAEVVERAHTNAFEAGQATAGNEVWINIWTPMLEEVKTDLNTKGLLLVCLETEALLRRQGQPTGIDGPSYACSKASTPTEIAMCGDANLWPKDRAISSIYFWIRHNVKPTTRNRLLAVQREWLAVRNACGADKQCLNRVYDQRLQELKSIDVPS